MSALSWLVTCGITFHAWPRCSAVLRRMLLSGLRSTSPHFEKSGSGCCAAAPPSRRARSAACAPSAWRTKPCTSSTVMRPPGPLPFTCRMSTPSSRAMRRTDGAAGGAGPAPAACFGDGRRLRRAARRAADVDDFPALRDAAPPRRRPRLARAGARCASGCSALPSLSPSRARLGAASVAVARPGWAPPSRPGCRLVLARLGSGWPSAAGRRLRVGCAVGGVVDREDRLADLDLLAGLHLHVLAPCRRPTRVPRSSPCRSRARGPLDPSQWCRRA